jgi:hypothetical protein
MYLMNHRSVLNGTPLDARHTNVALMARGLGYEPALFGYTDTSVDPRTVGPDDPRLRDYEGVLPGFDPVGYLPEGNPAAWIDWMRGEGSTFPTTGVFVDRPAEGSGATQYDAAHQTVPHRPLRLRRRSIGAASRGSHTVPSAAPSFSLAPPTRCSTPFGPPVLRGDVRGRRVHPLSADDDHPMSPPDDPQEQRSCATY